TRGVVGRVAPVRRARARSPARGRQRSRARRVPPPGVPVFRVDRGEEAVTFANPLPPWALAAVCAAALVVAWLAYRALPIARARRYALSTLRCVTLLWIVLCLMRPVGRPAA